MSKFAHFIYYGPLSEITQHNSVPKLGYSNIRVGTTWIYYLFTQTTFPHSVAVYLSSGPSYHSKNFRGLFDNVRERLEIYIGMIFPKDNAHANIHA